MRRKTKTPIYQPIVLHTQHFPTALVLVTPFISVGSECRFFDVEMLLSQVQLLLVALLPSVLLVQASGAPRTDMLTETLRADDKVSRAHRVWLKVEGGGNQRWRYCVPHLVSFTGNNFKLGSGVRGLFFLSCRLSLTCSCWSSFLGWWLTEMARRSRSWRQRKRWRGDTFPSPTESAKQAAAAFSGKRSPRVRTRKTLRYFRFLTVI